MPSRRRAFLLLLGLLATSGLVAASLRFYPARQLVWLASEAEGRKKAAAERRPVMLDFTADWCTACQVLATKNLVDPRVVAEAQGFVAIKVDATKEDDEAEAILARYRVSSLPTLLFLDAQGNEKVRLVNPTETAEILDALRKTR